MTRFLADAPRRSPPSCDHRQQSPPPSSTLHHLADRLARLRQDFGNPERFHCEKSELAHELRRVASALRRAGA